MAIFMNSESKTDISNMIKASVQCFLFKTPLGRQLLLYFFNFWFNLCCSLLLVHTTLNNGLLTTGTTCILCLDNLYTELTTLQFLSDFVSDFLFIHFKTDTKYHFLSNFFLIQNMINLLLSWLEVKLICKCLTRLRC